MKEIIEKFWKLPPSTQRRCWSILFMPKQFKVRLRPERDGDYLCCQAGAIVQAIGFCFLAVLLIDVVGQFEWFIDQELFADRKVLFIITWMKLMSIVAPFLTILFYLRLRLTMDLKNEQIPFLAAKDFMRRLKRREWIQSAALFLIVIFFGMTMPETYSQGFIEMYHLENSVVAAVIHQATFAFVIPFFVSFLISQALVLEKSIRFFPRAQEDLERW